MKKEKGQIMEWRPLKVMEFTETNGGQRERKDIYINGVFKIEMKNRECKEEYLKGRQTEERRKGRKNRGKNQGQREERWKNRRKKWKGRVWKEKWEG